MGQMAFKAVCPVCVSYVPCSIELCNAILIEYEAFLQKTHKKGEAKRKYRRKVCVVSFFFSNFTPNISMITKRERIIIIN